MRVTCPACHAESSLDVLIGREADARAVAGFIERHVAMGDLVVRYIGLFRPEKRRLGLGRTVALIEELLPDIERQAITRKGREWPAPQAVWRAAIEQVLANRAKGTVTLPLTSHGYLYEVIVGLADKAEALAEREREAQARSRPHVAGPATASALLNGSHELQAPVAPPSSYTAGPSRAARELQARIAAAQAARGPAAPSSPPEDAGGATP